MKPSSTTGTPRRSGATMTPTSTAISSPPTAARTPSGSAGSGRVDLDRALDGGDLAPARRVVDAGPATGHRAAGAPVSTAVEGAGGRRVADPHLADADQVEARLIKLARRDRARRRSPEAHRHGSSPGPRSCPPSRHGSWRGEPARPVTSPAAQPSGTSGTCAGDAGVHDDHVRARRAGQGVDRGATGQEVGDHLRGHVGRIRRHALAHDPVVGRGDDDRPGARPARPPAR